MTDTQHTDAWGEPRSKSITWHDPAVSASMMTTMTGLEFLQGLMDGTVPPPPITALTNTTLETVRFGEVSFRCSPDESVYNPIGLVHGGLVCTLLDSVAGCAVQSTLPAGTGYTSLEIKVSYLRAVHAGDDLRAIGRVAKPGRRAAFAEGEVRDSHDRLVATATSTCLVFPAT